MTTQPGREADDPVQYERIVALHNYLTTRYAGLSLHWVKIYGNRWAHLLGGGRDILSVPLKLELNADYGLFIENPEILAGEDLSNVVELVKGAFEG